MRAYREKREIYVSERYSDEGGMAEGCEGNRMK